MLGVGRVVDSTETSLCGREWLESSRSRIFHVIRPHHLLTLLTPLFPLLTHSPPPPPPPPPPVSPRRSMEAFRPRKSPLSERFLGSFSKTPGTVTQTPTATASNGGGGEFDEGEVFWIGTDFSSASSMPAHTGTTASHSISTSGSFRRVAPEKNFGILAALQEDEKKRATIRNPSFLQRKPSISSAAASPLSSPSSSSKSSTTSARMMMIPVVPKPKQEHAYSLPAGRGHQQSAPVNVPVAARRRAAWVEEVEGVDEGNDDDEEMLPPHEMVARASAKESPLMTFSVLEGVGRTLKGRDLRRVRNAVWRQTGFLD